MIRKAIPYLLFFIALYIGHIFYIHSDLYQEMNTNNFRIKQTTRHTDNIKIKNNIKNIKIQSLNSGNANIK